MGFFSNAKRVYNAGKIAKANKEAELIENAKAFSEEDRKRLLKIAEDNARRLEKNKILTEAEKGKTEIKASKAGAPKFDMSQKSATFNVKTNKQVGVIGNQTNIANKNEPKK